MKRLFCNRFSPRTARRWPMQMDLTFVNSVAIPMQFRHLSGHLCRLLLHAGRPIPRLQLTTQYADSRPDTSSTSGGMLLGKRWPITRNARAPRQQDVPPTDPSPATRGHPQRGPRHSGRDWRGGVGIFVTEALECQRCAHAWQRFVEVSTPRRRLPIEVHKPRDRHQRCPFGYCLQERECLEASASAATSSPDIERRWRGRP